MSAIKTDGTFTAATLASAARISMPIPRDTTARVVEQDFMIAFSSFSPLAISTAHATFTTAYLVEETPLQDLGGGIARWTRRYATVPASRDEFETFSFRFPGFKGTGNPPYNQYWVGSDTGRDPFVTNVVSRLRYEYFLCKSGETYATPDAIPILPGIKFTLDSNDDAIMDYLFPASEYWSDTDPTMEEWQALIGGGSGIGSGAAAGEFIAEDSRVEQYLGNIYTRITRYVKAK